MRISMPFFCYILYSEKLDKYYTGSCEDIFHRVEQHNTGRNLSTKSGTPWVLKYSEQFSNRSDATQREAGIKKKKSRKYIEWLINSAS
ncbi:GIY-YIG nuclease family protein [Nibribacter koreensis]|uniref:GIY-YIG nuclease family protein n=1 Tax=Nibribacter koreensis TaxID=1084519 RepID=UPI003CD0C21B